MTYEEVKAIFARAEATDDEKKQALESLLETHVENKVQGLKTKNAELIAAEAKLKTAKAELEAKVTEITARDATLQQKLQEANPEDMKKALEAQYAERSKPLETKIAELTAQNAELTKYRETVSFEAAYKNAVSKNGQAFAFIPGGDVHFKRGVKDSGQWKLTTVDGEEIWMNEKGQTLDFFVQEYRNTAEGKALITDGNQGSGAPGGNHSPQTQTVNPWATKTLNLTKQAQIQKENATLAASLKQQAEALNAQG
jgi:hypothetical protein